MSALLNSSDGLHSLTDEEFNLAIQESLKEAERKLEEQMNALFVANSSQNEVLLQTSFVNNQIFLPWRDEDVKNERFEYPKESPFKVLIFSISLLLLISLIVSESFLNIRTLTFCF
jgi:hypothetical protein